MRDLGAGGRLWKAQTGAAVWSSERQTLLQVLLQVLIIITGNYNFFNLLTLVLTTSLLDDRHLAAEAGNGRRKKTPACECHLSQQPAVLTHVSSPHSPR